jgi:hypothetical protein
MRCFHRGQGWARLGARPRVYSLYYYMYIQVDASYIGTDYYYIMLYYCGVLCVYITI